MHTPLLVGVCLKRLFHEHGRPFHFSLSHVYHHVRVVVVVSVKQFSNYLFFPSRNVTLSPPVRSPHSPSRIFRSFSLHSQKEPSSLPCIHCANLIFYTFTVAPIISVFIEFATTIFALIFFFLASYRNVR